MNVDNITKGVWQITENMEEFLIHTDDIDICTVWAIGSLYENGINDAQLIAEAGNVANETGLSPRELLEQRDELVKALNYLLESYRADFQIITKGNLNKTETVKMANQTLNNCTNKTK